MANSHGNTRHTRLPVRTVRCLELLAAERGLTRSTMADLIIMEYAEAHSPEVVEAIGDLPEPRRALRPGGPVPVPERLAALE